MDVAPGNETDKSNRRTTCLFGFSVSGDLRFISHHDTLRLFSRALARACLPVRFSEGFNPHPRISIPLPRPVGVASDVEALVVEFDGQIDPTAVLRRHSEQSPAGIRIISVKTLKNGEKPEARLVRYRISLESDAPPELVQSVKRVLEADELVVNRKTAANGSARAIDIRPYLAELRAEGAELEFAINVTATGAARPAEVAGLLGFDAVSINHRIRRTEVQWH